jgi:hypothetical protein
MKNSSLLLLALLLPSTAMTENKQLDLKLDTSTFYEEVDEESSWARDENYRSSEQQLSSECREISMQIRSLQGKPQRKYALQQRFAAECLSR